MLLAKALKATEGVAGNKDVWVSISLYRLLLLYTLTLRVSKITETGWAYTGPDFGAAQSTTDNAANYWKNVGCAIFGKKNVFWYTLKDSNPDNKVKFAITDNLSVKPRFDISCPQQKSLPNLDSTSNSTNTTSSFTSNPTSNPSAKPSTTGNANSQGSKGSGAGIMASVSLVNSMAIALSVVFAAATWAL